MFRFQRNELRSLRKSWKIVVVSENEKIIYVQSIENNVEKNVKKECKKEFSPTRPHFCPKKDFCTLPLLFDAFRKKYDAKAITRN